MSTETNVREQKHGLQPTPPFPEDLGSVDLAENARQVLIRRYVRRGEDGQPGETIDDMFWRVAYHIAKAEETWGNEVIETAKEFYRLLTQKQFFPNSPTFTGAGTPLGQLAACFVLPISDDMGRDPAGIFQTLRDAALIQQTGGGNGFAFSRLRPKGTLVKTSAGQATGPVGFLRVYDKAFGEIAQGGSRRGANMGVLRVDHPDIEDFITCKTDENAITNFNISVGILDAFMEAVKKDDWWDLRFPDVNSPEYKGYQGTLEQAERDGVPIKTHRQVRARELFDKIVRQAHHNGEPGVLFLDAANRSNPVPHLYQLEATNPCVTGDTLIYTGAGLRRAEDLAFSELPIEVACDSRLGEENFLPASTVFQTGFKPVYRLTTTEGYELRLTGDHRLMTPSGWVAAGDLQPGDRLFLLNRKGGFGDTGSLDEGRALGWLVGDSTFSAFRSVLSFVNNSAGEPIPVHPALHRAAVHQHSSFPIAAMDHSEVVAAIRPEGMDGVSNRLKRWAAGHGLLENKFIVPQAVLEGCENMQRGFLQALFTADGQVSIREKTSWIRLSSRRLSLLKDVQRLLINFGIASRIVDNSRQPEKHRLGNTRELLIARDGKGDQFPQSPYDLLIENANLQTFNKEIGFLSNAKDSRLVECLSSIASAPRHLQKERFLVTFETLEPDGREIVYDLHQPDTHAFVANGLVVHNCGEQWLGPHENCCLGSINLSQYCGSEGAVDWEGLRQGVALATRFLDDVVDINAYVPAVPQLKEAALNARRIGLGIMGLADLMYHAGIRYGSEEGQEFAAQVMEFVRYHAMLTSIDLAAERGPFPAIEGSIYDPQNMQWQPPQPLSSYTHDWDRPLVDWSQVVHGIRQHGIRNAAQTTIAPTGTIATVAGCEGYGCEPVFALAYIRHVNDNGNDLQLTYTSPLFTKALVEAGLDETTRQEIIEQVAQKGTCQGILEVPEDIRHTFAVSEDISAEEHVRMQAALQAFVDNSLSKTINFPADATEEDVAQAYLLAYELGCKGITVYVTGSRQKVVLETHATAKQKGDGNELAGAAAASASADVSQLAIWHDKKKPRPRSLKGYTYQVNTPLGKAFVTINENGGSQPFEVFINTAKAGSETAAVSEAIGRLLSYILRLASPVAPRDRLTEAVRQLSGIGGGRSLGFGPNRVRSLPDGVAHALVEYLQSEQEEGSSTAQTPDNGYHHDDLLENYSDQLEPLPSTQQTSFIKSGDLCPECGQAALVNEEGCRKCYACGFSEC